MVINAFTIRKDALKRELSEAHSRISISFDSWTSLSYIAILGIIAHFINKIDKRRSTVLALRRLYGVYSGENMVEVLLQIFREYGISGRISFFIADNAESNDTCVDTAL